MTAAAREFEQRAPLGVSYEVGDVAELRPPDRRFDIAVGVQRLNYAENTASMERCAATSTGAWCRVASSSWEMLRCRTRPPPGASSYKGGALSAAKAA
ncbi:class I SAM-dependent methyltransferase [Streptomyces sp. NBC_01267]|uniref:class I SAM-dependent methyltransferase n=1 Tax=Streptomyces sp. NBC_01267 TaxID=2903805 RepID=UPI002E32D440|nr:class I SAM-dependent methyltransferase [Streptomyces sp. NBC_01267]